MDKLLIVDGHNLLFQMFYGMPARIVDRDGNPIHGVVGFIGALIKIIKLTSPSHVLVLFDGENTNFRSELYPEYKANRTDYSTVDERDNPFSQLAYIYKALDAMGIARHEENEFEVDDIIASYACRYSGNTKIIISSFDSDYFQLIGDNVSVLRYRGKASTVCDSGYVTGRYGVSPPCFADFKALTGDAADNIRGAEYIGVKTAAKLVNAFGGIDGIISNSDKIANGRIRRSVTDNADRLKCNLQLIKLNDAGKIPLSLKELAYKYDGATTVGVLETIGLRIK